MRRFEQIVEYEHRVAEYEQERSLGNYTHVLQPWMPGNGPCQVSKRAVDSAKPRVRGNIFVGHYSALLGNFSNLVDRNYPVTGDFAVRANLFFENEANMTRVSPDLDDEKENQTVIGLPPDTGSVFEQPGFVDPLRQDYRRRPDSPARKGKFGAAGFPSLESPFPLQPEERALIPDAGLWNSHQWKQLPNPDNHALEKRLIEVLPKSRGGPAGTKSTTFGRIWHHGASIIGRRPGVPATI